MNRFVRLGYWSAVLCGVGAIAYGVVSVLFGAFAPGAITWEGYQRFAVDYSPWPTMALVVAPLAVAVVFPLLVLALYATADGDRRPFGLLALMFAGVSAAVLGPAYWLQMTNVPWNILRGGGEEIAPWVMWNPASFFWSLETFGYFVMGLAWMFAALAYAPGHLPRRVRGGMLGMGPLGAWFLSTAVKDVVLNAETAWTTAWSLSAVAAWVVLFSFVSFGLAGWFKHHAEAFRDSRHRFEASRKAWPWQVT